MDALAPLIKSLHGEGRLRVWSLVMTVFGDLVQQRGGEISTARLGELLGRIGVEQGTLRTALSRLGRDGWVHSERVGRGSLYRLSEDGVAQFASASARIYAPPRDQAVTSWALSVTAGGAVDLRPAGDLAGDADLCVTGRLSQISPQYRANLLSPAHRLALTSLAADLAAVPVSFDCVLDAAAARILLVHRWRRIVLRFPDLPQEVMADDAPLRDPRRAVADVYHRLTPLAEAWLGDVAQTSSGINRFGGPQRA
ncbi:MAG: PaaX family transcriptional regulator C-terminal domain-containing protein [Sedimentitalea sp.]